MAMDELKRTLYVEDEQDIQAVAFSPDLLLLDVMMSGMNGPTTLQKLRKLSGLQETPAIFMTAKVQPQEVEHFKSLGALDVIPKPFDPMSLSQTVKDIWEKVSD